MPYPNIILDGTMPYGTEPITIDGTTYIVNSESVVPEYAEATDNKGNGQRNRKRGTRLPFKGDWEVQLATTGTTRPIPGKTFTRTVDGHGDVLFCIYGTPVEKNNEPNSIRACRFTAEEVVNGITTA